MSIFVATSHAHAMNTPQMTSGFQGLMSRTDESPKRVGAIAKSMVRLSILDQEMPFSRILSSSGFGVASSATR